MRAPGQSIGSDAPSVCNSYQSADALLEAAISVAHAGVIGAATLDECRAACRKLESLVGQRSISQVRFLERLKGLR